MRSIASIAVVTLASVSPAGLAQPDLAAANLSAAAASRPAEFAGDWVVVSADWVNLRARPTTKSRVITQAQRGTRLRSAGSLRGWRRVILPSGTTAFVSSKCIEAEQPRVDASPASQPVEVQPTSQSLSVAAQAASRPAHVSASELNGEWGRRLLELESQIETESRRPIAEQDWRGPLGRLRPIGEQSEEPTVARLATAWMALLEARAAQQERVRLLKQIAQRDAIERDRFEQELARIRRASEPPPDVPAKDMP